MYRNKLSTLRGQRIKNANGKKVQVKRNIEVKDRSQRLLEL